MIEIEKKFLAQDLQISLIEQTGTFLKKISFVDTYYDALDYRYTTKNVWLRKREESFELKVGIQGTKGIDRYEEITDLPLIAAKLGIGFSHSFEKGLERQGIVPYSTFRTTRSKYQMGQLFIDIDHAEDGDFIYRIVEIERMVETQEQISLAEEEILRLAERLQLESSAKIQAKLIAYLHQKKPEHYQALANAGIC